MEHFEKESMPVPTEQNEKKQKRKRVTQAEYLERLDTLLQLRGDGYLDSKLVKFAIFSYGISERHAYNLVEEVNKAEAALGKNSGHRLYSIALNRARRLYHRSVQKDDIRNQIRSTELEIRIIDRISRELPPDMHPFYS